MTNFIETQKELARKKIRNCKNDTCIFNTKDYVLLTDLDALITQVIQNTLEEVGRVVEGEIFKYEPPYEGQEDKEMERNWKNKVTALKDFQSLLAEMVIKKEV